MIDNEAIAQAQQGQAVSDHGQADADGQAPKPQESNQQHEGIQRRIDELVKANHTKDAQIAELVAAMAATATRGAVPAEQSPAVEIDPEQKKLLDAYFQPMMQHITQKVGQLDQFYSQSRLTQVASGEDPRVVERAQQLLADWQRRNLPGWSPEDALTMARGEIAGQERTRNAMSRDERGRFNAGGGLPLTTNGSQPPLNSNSTAQALPANFDDLPPAKQLEILEKRGAGDLPF